MLRFSPGRDNVKLRKLEYKLGGPLYTFSLLSGHTCPGAMDCHSKVVVEEGKKHIMDGPNTVFRCFSASQEALFPAVYTQRAANTDAIRACGNNQHTLTDLILSSLPADAIAIRIHIGGDFFTRNYFRAWLETARLVPHVRFYAYTKSLAFWVKDLANIPLNLILTASRGGKWDTLIDQHSLREARVVYTPNEAKLLGLAIDEDDSHAAFPGDSFALLLHGMQPAGTMASSHIWRGRNKMNA